MKQAAFVDRDLSRDRTIILFVVLIQLLSLLTIGLIAYFGRASLASMTLAVAAGGFAVFLLALAYLLLHYLTFPEVREKRRLQRQLKRIEKELIDARDQQAEAGQQVAKIRNQAQREIEDWQASHQSKVSDLEKQREALLKSQEEELQFELKRLQDEHREAGLKAVPLEIESIPGIGPTLAEKLLENNIRTAFDITPEPIQAILGFGESKAQSLLWWRESHERDLITSQPVDLPAELKTAILERYHNRLVQLDLEVQAASRALEGNLVEVHEHEARQLATAMSQEATVRQRLTDLEAEKRQAEDPFKSREPVTFLKFVSEAVRSGRSGFLVQVWTALLPFLLLISGLLLAVISLGLLIWMQF